MRSFFSLIFSSRSQNSLAGSSPNWNSFVFNLHSSSARIPGPATDYRSKPEPAMNLPTLPSQFNNNSPVFREIGKNPSWALPGTSQLRKYPSKSRKLPTKVCLATANGDFWKEKHGIGSRDGVIIVDHGSRRKASNLMLDEFVAMFRDKTGYPIVEPAHMELAEPSIRDAFGSCVQQGANRVIVSPFFLSPGRHWNQDIPSLTAEAAKEYPGVPYIISAPLGLHELLVDVVNDRINHCLSHVAGEAEECSVCVGTGKCKIHN